jgi:Fe-S cluster biogenesis protein NfuA
MVEERELREHAARIDAILTEIESCPDPRARDAMADVVQSLLALYGEGLARMLAVVSQQPDAALAARTIERFTEDALVAHLLLLHDLHPVDAATRVEQALDGVRPYLQSHGGDVELIGVEAGVARVRLNGHCKSCPSSALTLKSTVEEAIRKAAPELIAVEAETPAAAPANFVPMADLTPRPPSLAARSSLGKGEELAPSRLREGVGGRNGVEALR